MKIIKYYNEFINEEAIPYSDVKSYLEIERSESVIQKLNEIFDKLSNLEGATTSKRGDRVYIPYVNPDSEISKAQLEIEDALNENGYKITDYKKGLCVSEKGVTIKIGKLLNRLGLKKLLNKFNTDKAREDVKNKDVKRYIVFSKHPYDIAGMSTGRNWTSCMNIYDGNEKAYIRADIREGSIIAYLVNSNDLNINNPKSRILAKPFINQNNENDILYITDEVYGSTSSEFKKIVNEILNNIQESSINIYKIKKKLYDDNFSRFANFKDLKPDTKSDVENILNILKIKNFKINDDLTVDVNGSVYIDDFGLEKIPINFNKVSGDFKSDLNRLTSLLGAPKTIDGDFSCSFNQLTDLIGAPKSVGGDFECNFNKLTTLEGSPELISGKFSCLDNKLTDLVGSPKSVDGDFNCRFNNLFTFNGLPEKIGGDFKYDGNPVTALFNLIGNIEYIDLVVVDNKLDLNKLNSLLKEMGKPPIGGIRDYKNL